VALCLFIANSAHWITLNGRLEGRIAKLKTLIYCGLASCTEGQAGRLHYRTGQWAAH